MANRVYPYLKTTAPTVDDDTGDGYKRGDTWLDTTNRVIWQAIGVTAGSADWLEISNESWIRPYKLSVTVSANDLVVALKHPDGTDPSTSRPLYFQIGSTVRSVTAATSITVPDGTNYFNAGSAELGTQTVGFFPYVVYDSNSTIVALSISRIPYGRLVSDFSATTTNEKHLFNYANFTSTDEVANIGYFEATLSLSATSHLWTVPTFTNANLKHETTLETGWLAWAAAITGFSAPPTFLTFYKVQGSEVFWIVHASASGTSNLTTSTLTLPFTAANVTNLNNWCVGRGQDNGSEVSPTFRIVYNTNVLDAYKGPGNTAWTASGTKYFSGQGFYRIA